MHLPSRVEQLIGGWPGQLLVLVVGLLATALVAGQALASERRATASEFRADAVAAVDAVQAQIDLGVGAAEAAAGLVLSSEDVTEEEFRDFTRALQVGTRYPELSSLALTRRERDPDRWVVTYIEPLEGNTGVIGVDLLQDAVSAEAGQAAVDGRTPVMTAPIDLAGVVAGDVGLSVLVPYYERQVGPSTIQARRDQHRGFTSIFFRTDDLLAVALADLPSLAMTIVDAGAGDVLTTFRPEGAGDLPEDRRTEVVQRDVLGRRWVVTVSAAHGYGTGAALPTAMALSGVVLTLLLVVLLRGVDRSGHRARRLAAAATAELRASEAALERANEELSRHNRSLERANAELSRFAGAASHDLKQPVQLVIAFSELLQELLTTRLGEEGLEELERTALEKVQQGGLRMRQLIDDLLDLAMADRGVERFGELDVAAAVGEVIDVLASRAEELGAAFHLGRLDPVTMDQRQLLPLLQNLIGNAVKYHRPDRSPNVHIEAMAHDGRWRLTVTDDGIGIPPESRIAVFEAFTRLDRGAGVEGSGVGLAICAAIADGHGGTVTAIDGIDGGTAVVVDLPQPPEPPGGPAVSR